MAEYNQNDQYTGSGEKFNLPVFLITSAISLIVSAVCAFIVFSIIKHADAVKAADIAESIGKYAIDTGNFMPESRETFSYAFFILSYLIVFTLLNLFFIKKGLLKNPPRWARITAYSLVSVAAVLLFIYAFLYEDFFFFSQTYLFRPLKLLIAVPLSAGMYFALYKTSPKIKNVICFSLCGLLCGLVLYFNFFTNFMFTHFNAHHVSAYYFSIQDVYTGSTLPLDSSTLYGFYAYLAMPFFRIFGLTLNTFAVWICLQFAVICFCVIYITYKCTRDAVFTLLGLATFAALVIFLGSTHDAGPYFQYIPHRIVFPAAVLAYICFCNYSVKNKKSLYKLWGYILCCLSIIWNFETGLFCLITYTLFFVYKELTLRGLKEKDFWLSVLRLTVYFALTVALFFLFIMSVGYIKSGRYISPSMIMGGYRTILSEGYFMIAVSNLLHPGFMAVALYLVVITVCLRSTKLINTYELSQRSPVIFSLSVMGLGVFTYYLGRTHDFNLIVALWPLILLFPIAVCSLKDRLNIKKSKTDPTQIAILPVWLLTLALLLIFSTASIYPFFNNDMTRTYLENKTSGTALFDRDTDFIEEYLNENKEVALMSEYGSIYLTRLQASNLIKFKSSVDWFYVSDLESALQLLKENDGDFIISESVENIFIGKLSEQYQSFLSDFQLADISGQTEGYFYSLKYYRKTS